jgi:hypothetical protein
MAVAEPVGLIDGHVLGHHFADHDMAIRHQQKRQHEACRMERAGGGGREHGLRQGVEQGKERVFARPAEPETGQRDAHLRDGQQLFGLRQQRESHAGAGVAFGGHVAEARIPY